MKMGPGDTVFYAGTSLGVVFEVSVATGAVRRQFQTGGAFVDLDVSPDGKTLAIADGSSTVQLIRLATGGLSGTVDFGTAVGGLAFAPDMSQLWVTLKDFVYAAPAENGSFNPNLVAGRTQVAGTLLSRIAFAKIGNVALVIDEAGNQVVVIK